MLSNNVPSTPRPRPPAKMRRAPSLPLHPPPPYAPRMDMILDSPIAVTTQLIKSSPGEAALGTPDMEDWMNERSREELSDLLVAAEGIIKTRESELGLTSALCKNLYDENVHLKTKHDALLARLPKQGPSPLPSPTRSLSPLPPGSPHYYSISRPGSPIVRTSPVARHARRISVTPSELTLLADQNEELLEKLEQLEEESAQADLAGKRKLRKLEREIMGLREELEKTRAKGDELEQKVTVHALSEDELLRRRREERERREERAKALREKSSAASSAGSTGDGSLDEPVRDFAPPPELPSLKNAIKSPGTPSINLAGRALSPLPPFTSARKLTSPMSEPLPLQTVPEDTPSIRSESRLRVHPRPKLPSGASSYFPPTTQESTTHVPSLEYAVITQLLAKIRELEETNTQISSDQKATAERLQAAQWDAESISRAYECLVDGQREVHVVEDEPADTDDSIDANTSLDDSPARRTKHQSTGDTIRFSSLRRTIDGNLSRTSSSSGVFSVPTSPDREQIELDFAEGIRRELQSTTRSRLAGLPVSEPAGTSAGSHREHSHHGHKSRKSVMGLFDGVEVADAESARDADPLYPKTLSVSPAFLAQTKGADGSGDADGDVSIWSTDATDGLALHARSRSGSPSASGMPSFLISPSASRVPSPSPSMHRFPTGSRNGHTLGSELGMEDWPAETGRWNYHLRTSSLCDITGVGNESAIAASAASAAVVAAPLSADGTSPTATAPTAASADSDETPVVRSPIASPKLASPAGSSGWEDVSEDERPQKAKAKDRNASRAEHSTASVGSTTPTRTGDVFKLQLVIEPPTPSPNRPLRTSRSARSLRVPMSGLGLGLLEEDSRVGEGRASRNQRLSQTVRARTSRWVERMERRYGTLGVEDGVRASGSAFASGSGPGRPVRKRRSLGALRGHGHGHGHGARHSTMDMDETFEAIMAQFSRSHSALSAIASGARPGFGDSFDADADADPDKSLLSADMDVSREEGAGDVSLSAEVMAARPRREGFAGLLLEVWLWLQFAVVVMVFLWAMARRGPKSVLEDAERRRGVVRR
ncbi:hypothetical protein EIP86_004026 [Pleurotus ostreatoroseus]|nr:hypothetical protein EIP86_004026 [Pleurotus ostreatoroseus]